VQGAGFRVLDLGFRISNFGLNGSGLGLRVAGIWFQVSGFGSSSGKPQFDMRLQGSYFRVSYVHISVVWGFREYARQAPFRSGPRGFESPNPSRSSPLARVRASPG